MMGWRFQSADRVALNCHSQGQGQSCLDSLKISLRRLQWKRRDSHSSHPVYRSVVHPATLLTLSRLPVQGPSLLAHTRASSFDVFSQGPIFTYEKIRHQAELQQVHGRNVQRFQQ